MDDTSTEPKQRRSRTPNPGKRKFDFKEHPVVVIASAMGATILLCIAVFSQLHSMVVEKKDGTIETKQAVVDSLKEENETLRRRLQGDVILVSTNDLQATRDQVAQIENRFAKELQNVSESLSQLKDIRATLDRSINQTTPEAFGELRRIANVRPNGANVNWFGDRRGGAGMAAVGPSQIAQQLNEAFEKFNQRDTAGAAALFSEIGNNEPLWPYAHFYLGLNALNAAQPAAKLFEEAAKRFEALRKVGIVEPELLLYESMTRTFLGDFETVRSLLKKLEDFHDNVQQITVLVAPKSAPEDILTRYTSISEKHKTPLVLGDAVAR